jgi:hypothetical protein
VHPLSETPQAWRLADDSHIREMPSRWRFFKAEGATLMISEQIVTQDPTRTAARTWRLVAVSLPEAASLTFTSRVTRAIHGFAKAPMLPYAALFAAEMLLGMRRKREYFEPDPFATEAPFLDDSWPRI